MKNSNVPMRRVVHIDEDESGGEASLQEAEAVVVRDELVDQVA